MLSKLRLSLPRCLWGPAARWSRSGRKLRSSWISDSPDFTGGELVDFPRLQQSQQQAAAQFEACLQQYMRVGSSQTSVSKSLSRHSIPVGLRHCAKPLHSSGKSSGREVRRIVNLREVGLLMLSREPPGHGHCVPRRSPLPVGPKLLQELNIISRRAHDESKRSWVPGKSSSARQYLVLSSSCGFYLLSLVPESGQSRELSTLTAGTICPRRRG